MFISIEEMKSVLYEYQMNEIAENDDQIITDGILSAVSEVKSYFTASNQKQWNDGRPRYDVPAIFGASGIDRDAWVLRMCKTVAAYYICELSNIDIIYSHVKERYERVINTLEKIAGLGDYKDGATLTPDLPTIDPDNPDHRPIFRFGSVAKFNHE